MSEWKLKRFWEKTDVGPVEGGYAVTLDGRGVKTPAKASLVVPTRALADAIAKEWAAQENDVDPGTMPVTRTANSAIDKVAVQQAEVAGLLADYADSDLLCYRAERPDELVARQAAAWDPYLDWAAKELGASLVPVTGVMHAPQDGESLERLRDLTHQLSTFELAAFHDLVSLTGSLVLGFAAARDFADVEAIWLASRVDEIWQAEQWGADEEAVAAETLKKSEFLHAKAFFGCIQAA